MILQLFAVLGLFGSFASCKNAVSDLARGLDKNIAFNAQLEVKNAYFAPGTTIVFPKNTLNEGNGYDAETGKFTAPLAGVYMFTAHVCNSNSQYMVFAIEKNSDPLAISTTFVNSGSGCGSVNTIVKLQEGDVVNVVAKFTQSYLYADENRWNSFSGYLVFA